MARRNAQLISTRQWALYNYLNKCFEENPNRWVSPEEIYNNVPGYIWDYKAYDKCKGIRNDKKFLNSQDEKDKIIVMRDRNFKIATQEEAKYEIGQHYRRLIEQRAEIDNMKRKYKLDGYFKLLNNRGEEMTENCKPYRETFNHESMAESR